MKKLSYILVALMVVVIAAYRTQVSPAAQTTTIAAAANDLLNSLSADQRKSMQFEFLHPKVATGTQFNFNTMRGGPGAPNGQGSPPMARAALPMDALPMDALPVMAIRHTARTTGIVRGRIPETVLAAVPRLPANNTGKPYGPTSRSALPRAQASNWAA
jgi:hypothetical protein